jgi:hypothetical protein
MLIIGVLFVVALLAIGGAVWLSIGERQSSVRESAPRAAANREQIPAAATTSGQGAVVERPAAPATVPLEPDNLVSPAPVAPAPAAPAARKEQPFSVLNGQFYELAAELRALHREAQDIEQRLGVLTEMVSRIEREYGEVSLEAQ